MAAVLDQPSPALAAHIVETRQQAGLQQKDAARRCGRPVKWLWDREHARVMVRVEDLLLMQAAWGLDPHEALQLRKKEARNELESVRLSSAA